LLVVKPADEAEEVKLEVEAVDVVKGVEEFVYTAEVV
jgi:hypothetical protein